MIKTAQSGNRAGRTGGDGVIIVGHAVQNANRLNAVFHAGKGRADLTHGLDRDTAPDSGNGSQQVFNIVQAAEFDLGTRKDGRHRAVFGIAECVIALAQEGAVIRFMQAGKPDLLALAVCGHGAGNGIFIPQNRAAGRLLPEQNIALCINIFLHILVMVKVVGCHVGHNGHLGAAAHTDQLETGKFHHRHVIGLNVRQLRQQCRANIAAQEHMAPGSLKHFGNEGCRGGFTVRSGHGHNLAGAKFKEKFYLAGDHCARLLGGLKFRLEILIAGCAHDNVLPGKPVRVIFAQTKFYVQTAQRIGIIAEILNRFFLVTERNLCAQCSKHCDAGLVADARTDEGDLFPRHQFFQFFHGRHKTDSSFCRVMPIFFMAEKPQANQSVLINFIPVRPRGFRAYQGEHESWT